MVMSMNEYRDLLAPAIAEVFSTQVADLGETYKDRLYSVRDTDQSVIRVQGVGGFDINPFLQEQETGTIGELQRDRTFDKNFVPAEYNAHWTVRRSYIEDRSAMLGEEDNTSIARAYWDLVQRAAAAPFNNAFSASAPGPDGQPLCSSTHPKSKSDSTNAGSNTNTGAMTFDKVSDMAARLESRDNDAGNIIGGQANILLCNPALRRKAYAIANSMQIPDSANNDANPFFENLEVITWPYITSKTAFFVIDEMAMKFALRWYDRIRIDLVPTAIEETASIVRFPFRARFVNGFIDWRWVEGSTGV